MGFRQQDEDVRLEGISLGRRGKALMFQGDNMDEPIFIPVSQIVDMDQIPDEDSDEKRCSILVKGWIARKEGWE